MKKYLPILMFAASSSLWAQSEEAWLSGGASILANKNMGALSATGESSEVQLDGGFRFGLRLGYNTVGHIGHEFQYAYNHTNFVDHAGTLLPEAGRAGTGIHQFGYNFLYYMRAATEESKVRGFVTAGFHLSDFGLPVSASISGRSVRPGGNVGAGLKVKISTLFGARFDVREYVTGKPNWSGVLVNQRSPLSQTEISAGIGVFF